MSLSFVFHRIAELHSPPSYWAAQLRTRLHELGYCVENLAMLEGAVADPQQAFAAKLRSCLRSQEPYALLGRLWLLAQGVKREELEPLLGNTLIEFLCDWGLLFDLQGTLGATVDIYPCNDCLFLTDRSIGMQRELQSVYHLGGDSYALAWLAPRTPVKRALDLATGSGLHAVLAAGHAEEVHAVDISPRAIDFAGFNAVFNGRDTRVKLFQGDLYEALPGGRYDLILSNLPWVPAPDNSTELYRGGGADGQILVQKMVEGLSERLEVEGWMASYVEYPKFAEDSYTERVTRWLGEGSWGIVLMNLKHFTNADYVLPQVASHSADLYQEFDSWMESYERAQITGMAWALLYVKKLGVGPGWSLEVESDFPAEPQDWVASWLREIARAHSEEIPGSSALRLHPDAELWLGPSSCRIEWPTRSLRTLELGAEERRVLESLDLDDSYAPSVDDLRVLAGLRKLGVLEPLSRP